MSNIEHIKKLPLYARNVASVVGILGSKKMTNPINNQEKLTFCFIFHTVTKNNITNNKYDFKYLNLKI